MSVAGKDGAWVSGVRVAKLNCTKCGSFNLGEFPMNDRQLDAAITAHLVDKHGGVDRGY